MSQGLKEKEEEEPALKDMKYLEDREKQSVSVWFTFTTLFPTFLGEKTPRVPPSSRMATPISANKASLERAISISESQY